MITFTLTPIMNFVIMFVHEICVLKFLMSFLEVLFFNFIVGVWWVLDARVLSLRFVLEDICVDFVYLCWVYEFKRVWNKSINSRWSKAKNQEEKFVRTSWGVGGGMRHGCPRGASVLLPLLQSTRVSHLKWGVGAVRQECARVAWFTRLPSFVPSEFF